MAITTQSLGFAASTNIFTDTDIEGTVVVVKSSSTVVHIITIDNSLNGAQSFLKIWNSAGVVTIGTTVPDEIIMIPASAIITIAIVGGKTYATGLQVACTTTAVLAGVTSPTSAVTLRVVYV